MCGKKISETKMYKNTDVDWKDNYRKNKMSEKTKSLSNKLLIEKNIIKKEDTCLNHKRNRTQETKNESTMKKREQCENINEEVKETEDKKGIEGKELDDYFCKDNQEDQFQYDEIIKI